jgi:glycosyltransferase involved in cell wall biosynthesis
VGRAVARAKRATHHVQFHGDVFNPLTYKDSFFQRLRIIYGRYVVRHTNCFRVVSKRIRSSLVSLGVTAGSIYVLPIQADLSSFLEVYKNRIYKKDKANSFLYVGRFSPEKNLPLLLEAFAEVFKNNSDIHLTLVGTGALESIIKDKIAKLNIQAGVKIMPWTDSVTEVMAKHDVLCLSSDHEGWGMVLLEAAATGMPIITTDVGCAGEAIINDENGLVVPVRDVTAYTSALRTYIEKPALIEKHGRQGNITATHFSLSKEDYLQKIVESFTSCSD